MAQWHPDLDLMTIKQGPRIVNNTIKRIIPKLDQKSLRDSLKKTFFSSFSGLSDEELGDKLENILGKEVVNRVLKIAGQSKDELVLILGREIGFALAAMLKEPLTRLVKANKIKITIELESKEATDLPSKDSPAKPKTSRAKKKTTKTPRTSSKKM